MPDSPDQPDIPFDPRSELFLESLRGLIPFEVELCDMTEWCGRTEILHSTDIAEATRYAVNHLRGDRWEVVQVRRQIENEPNLRIPPLGDPAEFLEMARRMLGEE
jgi:hypothetical protein